jgi:predicted DNA binding CopG/RHH family protein
MKKRDKLDKKEQQMLDDFEEGKLKRIPNSAREKKDLEDAARQTLLKDRRINIRISSRDLERLQKRAAKEGIPYQTFISGSLHKLVTGRLKEVV